MQKNCEEKQIDYDEKLLQENGYAQTKWVAEQVLRKGIQQGLPITIYRIGKVLVFIFYLYFVFLRYYCFLVQLIFQKSKNIDFELVCKTKSIF